jgi:hypothetical protein
MVLTHKDILIKLEQIEKAMLQQDSKINKHEVEIQAILEALKELLNPATEPRPRIGFRRANSISHFLGNR